MIRDSELLLNGSLTYPMCFVVFQAEVKTVMYGCITLTQIISISKYRLEEFVFCIGCGSLEKLAFDCFRTVQS